MPLTYKISTNQHGTNNDGYNFVGKFRKVCQQIKSLSGFYNT